MRALLRSRVIAVLVALPLVAGGGVVALLGLYGMGLTCDESCDPRSSSWRDDPDAWQWTAQGVMALTASTALVVTAGLLIAGRRRAAGGAFAVALLTALAWLALVWAG